MHAGESDTTKSNSVPCPLRLRASKARLKGIPVELPHYRSHIILQQRASAIPVWYLSTYRVASLPPCLKAASFPQLHELRSHPPANHLLYHPTDPPCSCLSPPQLATLTTFLDHRPITVAFRHLLLLPGDALGSKGSQLVAHKTPTSVVIYDYTQEACH